MSSPLETEEYVEILQYNLIQPLTYCRWIPKSTGVLTPGAYLKLTYIDDEGNHKMIFQNHVSADKSQTMKVFGVSSGSITKMFCKRDARTEIVSDQLEYLESRVSKLESIIEKLINKK